MNEKILLIGCGGQARVVVDILLEQKIYEIAGFVDNNMAVYRNISTIGQDKDLEDLFASGIKNAFICVGALANTNIRGSLFNKLSLIGFNFPNIIDSSVMLGYNVTMESGNFLAIGVIVNNNVRIGSNCLINTGVIIEHDVILGNNVHLAPRVTICGDVELGHNCFVGASAVILESRKIREKIIIGALSLVNKDILESGISGYGLPFRKKIT